jgi:nucleotide-binding universal stress UspA family protein
MSLPFERILIPISHTQADTGLAAWARLLAPRDVHLVHVPGAGPGEPLGWAEALAAGFGPDLAARLHVRQGHLLDQVLECAAETRAELIVVGHQLAHGARRSLARRLAMKAPCSVLMVPDDRAARLSRILAPIDFSIRSADALRTAMQIARLRGIREVAAFHAYFDDAVISYEGHARIARGQEEAAFREFLAPLETSDVEIRPCWEECANIAHAILRVADDELADLVVMGTRGRSPSAAVLLGSETDHLLMEATRPVLAVKHFGARLAVLEALLDRRFRRREEPHFG